MLSSADAELAGRDPDVPGLATLLDPEALTDRLHCFLGRADFEVGPVRYVKYQPGKNCLAGYELRKGPSSAPIHATAYRFDALHKFDKARYQHSVAGSLGPPITVLADSVIVVRFFPNDRKLSCLPALADRERRQDFLGRLLPVRSDLCNVDLQTIVYKPELRYVACLLSSSQPGALLKIYNQRSYGTARNNACAFTSSGDLRLPKLLGSSDSDALLALEWLPGHLLSDALSGATSECDLRRVGRALGLLHTQEPDGLPLTTHRMQATDLAEVARALGILCPGLAERARRIAAKLGAALCELRPRVASIHGDFYSRQVLLTSGTVSILDLDAAARGDPATDIGNFIAYLERETPSRRTLSRTSRWIR